MIQLFEGEKSSYRDIVVLNAAAAFCVADSVNNYEEGIELALLILLQWNMQQVYLNFVQKM